MGAALSYYTVFSLAPLLLMVISIAGLVFGEEAARGEIFGQVAGLMGADAAKAIEGLLASVNKPAEGVAATLLGVVLLLIGATTVFGELQDALDRIWRAPARERSAGWWKLLRARLLSFGMILGIAFLLMVSLVLSAAISALGKWWDGFFGGWETVAQVVNFAIGFLLTAGVFAMIYKIMPRVQRALARRLARRGRDRAAVLDRQVPDRPVHRQERRRLGLRRRRLARRDLRLGLLLGADLPDGRRVHLGLRAHLRLRCATSRARRRKRDADLPRRTGEMPARRRGAVAGTDTRAAAPRELARRRVGFAVGSPCATCCRASCAGSDRSRRPGAGYDAGPSLGSPRCREASRPC
jgi:hypothetical protein